MTAPTQPCGDEPAETTVREDRFWTPEEVRDLRSGRRTQMAAEQGSLEKPATALSYVAAGLAHDLNNVLAPVITSIEVLRMHCANDEKVCQILALIERQARQGPFLIKQILSLAHGVENSHTQLQPGTTLRAVRKHVSDTFPANIQKQFKIPAGLWPVMGSAPQLHEVLLNLCLNARDAMPQGGTLTVSVENAALNDEHSFVPAGTPAARHLVFTVADTGTGIPEEVHDRIFEAEFTTKKEPTGHGLGLYRANQIVEAHGGRITVESEPGHGSIFRVYLPAAPGTLPEISADDEKLLRGHGEGILVVDDEEAIRAITRETFESFGYRVLLASNGADAVSTYLQEGGNIALVFTDMSMPIMDGAMAIHALRDINPEVKIIATSGLDATGQQTRAADAGADRFIAKPYTAAHLLRVVHETLSETK